jgi:hypothetical protein
MPIWRLQASWQLDTALPRDKVVITPHFDDKGATTDPQNLCDDLLSGILAITPFAGEVQVKAYDAQGTVPVYPQGDALVQKGLSASWAAPREIAVCLSFYSQRNVKRQRGRLYMPAGFLGQVSLGLRPPSPLPKMESMVTLLKDLGGVDVDWCVYSRVLDRAFPVTNWWYDNEWDVQRSRGGRSTLRVLGTTSEAAGDEPATHTESMV